jgi:hypothetical protein
VRWTRQETCPFDIRDCLLGIEFSQSLLTSTRYLGKRVGAAELEPHVLSRLQHFERLSVTLRCQRQPSSDPIRLVGD